MTPMKIIRVNQTGYRFVFTYRNITHASSCLYENECDCMHMMLNFADKLGVGKRDIQWDEIDGIELTV